MGRIAVPVVILGIFVADAGFRAARLPRMGETLLGEGFALGPGSKGSNPAVAAARAGAEVHFLTRPGRDAFADGARGIWAEAGVRPVVIVDADRATGAAFIFLDAATGDNAIIVCPGAAVALSIADVEDHAALIRSAGVFVVQLEQPVAMAGRALALAREGGRAHDPEPGPGRGPSRRLPRFATS